MLVIKGLSFAYKKEQVLNEIDLVVPQGQVVAIVGRSGCGKSTLIQLIVGLLTAQSGKITWCNQELKLGDVGYMPQKALLLPWLKVAENVTLYDRLNHQTRTSKELVQSWLARAGLADYHDAYPHELSGGMQQRVAFLRTLLTGKSLLILDEPFGALDSMTKHDMQEWLLSLISEQDKTLIFVTHDLEEALYLSDTIVVLGEKSKAPSLMALPFSRPRQPDLRYSPAFIALRQELERRLRYHD